jgi:hypothetical protein
MRWTILKALLNKELQRHLAQRGSLLMIVLLIVASLLLSVFGQRAPGQTGLIGAVQRCYVDYDELTPLVEHLKQNQPDSLRGRLWFRSLSEAGVSSIGTIVYPQNTAAIQIRKPRQENELAFVWLWYPGDRSAMAAYEVWFWQESLRFAQQQNLNAGSALSINQPLGFRASSFEQTLDAQSSLAMSLVMFGLFFVCVYLLPSMACEERERGVIVAQALSPASPMEILAARFLFYPFVAIFLAAILAGAYAPVVLTRPLFWAVMIVLVCGAMGVGLTISCLARTQRAASLGAMCYMLMVSLFLMICQQANIPALPWLALEYHGPRMVHAVLTDHFDLENWISLAVSAFIACCWTWGAASLFRKHGWQ